jgi:dTDP-4-amino-4,6-dideoxygalactose transaminase
MKLLDLNRADQEYLFEINEAIKEVIRHGQFIQGLEVKAVEQQLAARLEAPHVITCANGTDALTIVFKALELPAGAQVLMPSFNYVASAETACALGLVPVFVDVEPTSFGLDTQDLERKITARTRAIVAVHLFGQPCDMPAIMAIANRHQLVVIEDNAQSLGSWYSLNGTQVVAGNLGHIATSSFFPTKNLGCYGDGGVIYTHQPELAHACRQIASHGQSKKYHYVRVGMNSRLDTLQAAILLVKLKALDQALDQRRTIAERYSNAFQSVRQLVVPLENPGFWHTYNQYTLRVLDNRRDALRDYLQAQDIPTMVYYPVPIHQTPAYKDCPAEGLAVTEKLVKEVVSLPIYPGMPTADQDRVIASVLNFFTHG